MNRVLRACFERSQQRALHCWEQRLFSQELEHSISRREAGQCVVLRFLVLVREVTSNE